MKNTFKVLQTAFLLVAFVFSTQAQQDSMRTNGTGDDINNTGTVGVSGWTSFNQLAKEMMALDGANYVETQNIIRRLNPIAANLEATRPMWMDTEEIKEDVSDFQKDFNELASEKYASEREYRENLEEISEQFEDLREEIDETYLAYAKINRQAYEEAKEEMENKRTNRLTLDASEEATEEITDLAEVRDGSKKSKREANRIEKRLRKEQKRRERLAKKEAKDNM